MQANTQTTPRGEVTMIAPDGNTVRIYKDRSRFTWMAAEAGKDYLQGFQTKRDAIDWYRYFGHLNGHGNYQLLSA